MDGRFLFKVFVIAVCFTSIFSWIYDIICQEIIKRETLNGKYKGPSTHPMKKSSMQGIFRASDIQRGDGILRERGDIINSEVFYNMKRFQLYSERDTKGRTVKADINVLQDICKIRRNVEINCQKVLQGNENEINKCNEIKYKLRSLSYIDKHSAKTISCDTYKTDSGFITQSLSKEENDFPIAFSILMYKDFIQFEKLLREIYRPQNVYCIHVDLKAKSAVFNRVSMISNCFKNVHLASRRINVTWGRYSVLEADLICMEDLLKYKRWRYFINLTGQEFPLRTNFELVQILSVFNGANDIKGIIKRASPIRWKNAGDIPMGARPLKSCTHISASRAFVNYAVHNNTAQQILNWTRSVKVPDEIYFGVLNFSPQIEAPGAFKGNPEDKPFLTRLKLWETKRLPCYGHRERGICIFGISDLQTLYKRPELFANKFHHLDNPVVLQCLSEMLCNRTKDENIGTLQFNTSLYERLNFVREN